MASYALKRLLLALPVMLGVTLVAFLMVRVSPGGPARAILGEKATEEKIAELNRINGWDKPLAVQYVRFVAGLIRGFDLGESYHRRIPVSRELLRHFPATFELASAAMLLAVLFGVTAGVVSAVRKNRLSDYASMTAALVGVSVPVFFLGILMLMAFPFLPGGGRLSVTLDLEPITGLVPVDALLRADTVALRDWCLHLIMPALALSTIPMAMIARMTRSAFLDVLGEDFVRTARAKGLPARTVLIKHAMRAALIPVVTVIGLNFGYLLGGAVLTESVFNWPGLGLYVVNSILSSDYNCVQGGILVVAGAFVLINLLVDLSYGVIDPRIRVS